MVFSSERRKFQCLIVCLISQAVVSQLEGLKACLEIQLLLNYCQNLVQNHPSQLIISSQAPRHHPHIAIMFKFLTITVTDRRCCSYWLSVMLALVAETRMVHRYLAQFVSVSKGNRQ